MTEALESRRDALRRGAVAAVALAAGGLLRAAPASAQSPDDEDLRDFLVQAIGLEQITVLAYSTASDQAGPDLKRTLVKFRDQEQAHVNALRQANDELGFDSPDAPDSPTDTAVFEGVDGIDDDAKKTLDDQLASIDKAKGLDQLLDVLLQLETDQITYYVGQGPGLDSADLATTAVEIAGCQGQHLTVLGLQTGRSAEDAADAAAQAAAKAASAEASQ